jgi:iron complex transport system permease protein
VTTAAPRAQHAGEPGAGVLTGLRRRRLLVLVLLLALLGLACVASVAVGAKPIPPAEVWSALVAPTGSENDIIIRALRIPRTILGVMVGAALGLAGALMQGHTRNPLAEPGILGVNAGAAFAIVLAIYLLGITSLLGFVWFGFAGALLASVLVFVLGSLGQGGATPVTLALAGIAVTVFLFALVQAMLLLSQETLDVYRFWVVGSLAGRDSAVILQVLPFLVAGLVFALANAPGLNALALGEDVAAALGQSVRLVRLVGVAAITLLAGGAVAAAGPITFLGLVVPHGARYVTGPDHRWVLPYSALLGAIVILIADVIGRVVMRPGELQVGIVLALLGAPFFIALVRRKRLMKL